MCVCVIYNRSIYLPIYLSTCLSTYLPYLCACKYMYVCIYIYICVCVWCNSFCLVHVYAYVVNACLLVHPCMCTALSAFVCLFISLLTHLLTYLLTHLLAYLIAHSDIPVVIFLYTSMYYVLWYSSWHSTKHVILRTKAVQCNITIVNLLAHKAMELTCTYTYESSIHAMTQHSLECTLHREKCVMEHVKS